MGFLFVINEHIGFFFSFLCLYVRCECCLSVTLGETCQFMAVCCCSVPVLHSLSWSLLKFMSIEVVMLSNHLILCCPLLLPSGFSSTRVFPNESALHIRWPSIGTSA